MKQKVLIFLLSYVTMFVSAQEITVEDAYSRTYYRLEYVVIS